MDKIERLYDCLQILREEIMNIFKANKIYIGAVDIRFLDDDEMWDKYGEDLPSGLRFCFSNHESHLVIPFDVLKQIDQKAGDSTITFEQNSAEHSKALYLYMNVDLSEKLIKYI